MKSVLIAAMHAATFMMMHSPEPGGPVGGTSLDIQPPADPHPPQQPEAPTEPVTETSNDAGAGAPQIDPSDPPALNHPEDGTKNLPEDEKASEGATEELDKKVESLAGDIKAELDPAADPEPKPEIPQGGASESEVEDLKKEENAKNEASVRAHAAFESGEDTEPPTELGNRQIVAINTSGFRGAGKVVGNYGEGDLVPGLSLVAVYTDHKLIAVLPENIVE